MEILLHQFIQSSSDVHKFLEHFWKIVAINYEKYFCFQFIFLQDVNFGLSFMNIHLFKLKTMIILNLILKNVCEHLVILRVKMLILLYSLLNLTELLFLSLAQF